MYVGGRESIAIQEEAAGPEPCHTGSVSRTEIADRFATLWRSTGPPPRPSRWAWAVDAVLALVLAAGAVDGALTRNGDIPSPGLAGAPVPPNVYLPHYGPVHWWQLMLAALTALPLVVRRRYPVAALWAVICASQLYHLSPGFEPTFTFTACIIAACGAAMYSPFQPLAIASAVVGAGLVVGDHKESVPALRPGLVTTLFVILVGLAVYSWRQRVRALVAEQRAATRLAVDRERSRIAHELHDVVTHNVSMMVVQAGAARKVMAMAPEKANDALLAVESGGRAAMTELRHAMGLLAMNGDNPDQLDTGALTPPPGLEQVAGLAARVRETGVRVGLTVTGSPVPLPAGLDLAAYRVVQESLTNAVKHAVGASVEITIDYQPGVLRLEVADTGGTSAASATSGSGRGLLGLRERLALYGGTLETGMRPTSGFLVRAVIPMEKP